LFAWQQLGRLFIHLDREGRKKYNQAKVRILKAKSSAMYGGTEVSDISLTNRYQSGFVDWIPVEVYCKSPASHLQD
jgi:hypothetical protein